MFVPGSRGFVVLLGALTALSALSIDMSLPALPLLTELFHSTTASAQWTLSGFLLGFAMSQLFCGPLADRFGRRPILLAGLGIFTVGTIGCAISQSMSQLIAFRVLAGFGACVGPILGRTVVRDLFDRQQAAGIFSAMTIVMAVAPLVAPSLGGYFVAYLSWRLIFVVIGAAGLTLLVVTGMKLGESIKLRDPHALRPGQIIGNYRRFLTHRTSMGYAIVNCLVFAGLFSYISGSPFVLIQVFGVPTDLFGYVFALPALALMAGASVNTRMLHRLAPETILQIGLAIILVSGISIIAAALLRIGGAAGVMAPMICYVFAIGIVLPNSTAAAMEPMPSMAGIASSLLGCLQMTAGGLTGYFTSAFYDHTAVPMSASVAVMGAAAFAVYYLVVHRAHRAAGSVAVRSDGD